MKWGQHSVYLAMGTWRTSMAKALVFLHLLLTLIWCVKAASAETATPTNLTGSSVPVHNETTGFIILTQAENNHNDSNFGVIITEVEDHGNWSLDDLIPQSEPNITCTQRDYNDNITAIFRGPPGPIEKAYIVFNSTFEDFRLGIVSNLEPFVNSTALNDTIVDCDQFYIARTRLGWGARHSLAG